MKQVAHLMRKMLPPTASFIYNQIVHYRTFVPHVIYCEAVDSVFADRLSETYPVYSPLRGAADRLRYRLARQLSPAARRRLIRYLRTNRIDLLHVHYGVDALVYADVFRELDIPGLVSFYGYDCTSFPNRFGGWGRQWLRRSLFDNPHVSAYTAMSPDMKEDLRQLGCPPEKIIVHYHGSDPEPFWYERSYPEKEDVRLLIVSSLTAKKGHAFLLEAFRQAQLQTAQNLYLHMVGDGELQGALAQQMREQSIEQAYLHGPVDYGSEQHHVFLEEADIFVHPSVTTTQGEKEGIPGALIEARSSGLPVVATQHAGLPFVVEHEQTGLLVPEYDTEALAQALVRLAEDATLRAQLGRAGQAYTRAQLDVKEKQKDLEQIFLTILNNPVN